MKVLGAIYMASSAFLQATKALYQLARPFIFRQSAQDAHHRVLDLLTQTDANPAMLSAVQLVNKLAFQPHEVSVGGVRLPHPFILAAGFVKGLGFGDEKAALAAIKQHVNLIPGWRTMPAMVGPVEFGSITRYPRIGNSGVVMWRDKATYSTQNRVGLKNPGAVAAAAFLSVNKNALPPIFGINIAVSPGVSDPEEEKTHVIEAINAFIARGVYPTWFTLNLSCPNTEDDPEGNQTERGARDLCGAVTERLANAKAETGRDFPLWVKVSPNLSSEQYAVLIRAFHETGVKAVISTNTLPASAPNDANVTAGVGGGKLHEAAVEATRILTCEARKHAYAVDVIGCGGVQDPQSYRNFASAGAKAVQYWSCMIYRGPLVAALILNEVVNDSHRK